MSFDQFNHGDRIQNDINGGDSSLYKWASTSPVVSHSNDNPSAFDCNICLESVQDPVVTFCGHLFCWPCIYRWFYHNKITGKRSEHSQECPVCKAEVSESTLIPLYGRGLTTKSLKDYVSDKDISVPSRPLGPANKIDMLRSYKRRLNTNISQHLYYESHPPHSRLDHPYLRNYSASDAFSLGGNVTLRSVCSPLFSVFGDMVYTMSGDSDANLYASPSYHFGHITSPRVRRRMMQANKSLGRFSFFLFCCAIMCLLSF